MLLAVLLLGAVVWWVFLRGDDPPAANTSTGGSVSAPPRPGSEPPPTDQATEPANPPAEGAEAQASAVNDLIERSKPSRGALGPAIAQVRGCEQIDEGIKTIRRVTGERRDQAQQAKSLAVDGLTGGEELKADLVRALESSQRADERYLAWAQRFKAEGCRGQTTGDPDFDEGNRISAEATQAKNAFVRKWNAIADEHGLPTRTAAEI
ncbi:hypothetical protein D5H75_26180 [Bailinhaonella thermotolerans]|uniref:Uncharacterized protein n=1 Tax=Bailinhaonella thermotolerans TaxID=1070861 RepID=A0A3A4AY11_9ACTN|nr:hypothetical protein D5H75_26180 [Bailinhaonella thermotolerans]